MSHEPWHIGVSHDTHTPLWRSGQHTPINESRYAHECVMTHDTYKWVPTHRHLNGGAAKTHMNKSCCRYEQVMTDDKYVSSGKSWHTCDTAATQVQQGAGKTGLITQVCRRCVMTYQTTHICRLSWLERARQALSPISINTSPCSHKHSLTYTRAYAETHKT